MDENTLLMSVIVFFTFMMGHFVTSLWLSDSHIKSKYPKDDSSDKERTPTTSLLKKESTQMYVVRLHGGKWLATLIDGHRPLPTYDAIFAMSFQDFRLADDVARMVGGTVHTLSQEWVTDSSNHTHSASTMPITDSPTSTIKYNLTHDTELDDFTNYDDF